MLKILLLSAALASAAAAPPAPDPDKQAAALVKQMTPAERNILLFSYFSRQNNKRATPLPGAPRAAGYRPGLARLGIPMLAQSDASLGVSWISGKRARDATALPS